MLRFNVSENYRNWEVRDQAIISSAHEITDFVLNFIIFVGKLQSSNKSDSSVHNDRLEDLQKLFKEAHLRFNKAFRKIRVIMNENMVSSKSVWRRNYVLSDALKYFQVK